MNFSPFLAKTGPYPVDLEVEKAEGCYFHTTDGKRYIDLIAGIGVSYVGHNHPHVTTAVKKQVDKHMHVMVYGEFQYQAQAQYAEKLCALLGTGFEQVFFTNSGTEAIEGALKLAKRITGKTKLFSFRNSYHGSTHGSLSVSGNESRKQAFRPLLPHISFLDFNDIESLKEIDNQTAAVIIETIQGDAGIRIPSPAFMAELRRVCTERQAILIFDEIQCGFGRTGKWFAFQQYGVSPDIICLGKSLGGGLPLGAFISSSSHMEALTHNPPLGHITTFGGNPVCCAAGLASTEVVENEQLMASVEEKGMLFETYLKHPAIKEFRRIGLFMAVELASEEAVEFIVKRCIEQGVLIYWFLSTKNSFRIAPPLVISKKQIKDSCDVILRCLDEWR